MNDDDPSSDNQNRPHASSFSALVVEPLGQPQNPPRPSAQHGAEAKGVALELRLDAGGDRGGAGLRLRDVLLRLLLRELQRVLPRVDRVVAVAPQLADLRAGERHGQRLLAQPARLERAQRGDALLGVARER